MDAILWLINSVSTVKRSHSFLRAIFSCYPNEHVEFKNDKITISYDIIAPEAWTETRELKITLISGEVVYHTISGCGWYEKKVHRPGAWETYIKNLKESMDKEHQKIDDSQLFEKGDLKMDKPCGPIVNLSDLTSNVVPPRTWDNVPQRKHAQAVIDDLASLAYKRMRAFQILEVVIPWNSLSKEEEETLWAYFSELRA